MVSNWKSRDTVPYKYVKKVRKKIRQSAETDQNRTQGYGFNPAGFVSEAFNSDDGFKLLLMNIKKLITSIKKNTVLFFSIPSIIIIATFFKVMALEPIYISEARIIPSSPSSSGPSSQLQSIASSFGLTTGSSQGGSITSVNLFPEVIKSRRLARTLLKRKFNTNKYGENKELISILSGITDTNKHDESLIKNGIKDIRERIKVISHVPKSPLIIISVSAFEPQLAADIADAVVFELNKLQKHFKSSRIAEKKIFISGRIQDVEKQLVKAEEELKIFRESNRNIMQSPSLQLEQERLMREVSTQMQIFLTLKSQFEIVQIELVERSNMVEILDRPEAPLQKYGPNRRLIMISAFIVSIILSIIIVFAKDWFESEYLLKS